MTYVTMGGVPTSRLGPAGLLLLSTVLALPACGGSDSRSGRGLAIHSERPLRGRAILQQVFRIGDTNAGPEYLFHWPTSIAVDPQGRIYVADSEGDLRLYDAHGGFVRRIARQGRGPGEIRFAHNMAVAVDGRLAVDDPANNRISIFDSTGILLDERRRPRGMTWYPRDGVSFDASGNLWLGINPTRSQLGKQELPRAAYARSDPDDELRDSIFLAPVYWERCPTRSDPRYSLGYWEDVRVKYLPKVKWFWGGGGKMLVGCPDTYAFDVVDLSTGAALRVSRSHEGIEVSSEEAREVRAQMGGVPPEKPAYHRLWVAEDGRYWVWPATSSERYAVPTRFRARGAPDFAWRHDTKGGFDVFATDGSWIGSVSVPDTWGVDIFPGRRDPVIRGDTIWTISIDSLGVFSVSRYLIGWEFGADTDLGR